MGRMLKTPKCSYVRCSKRSLILSRCRYCKKKYCLKHRFERSHRCTRVREGREMDRKQLEERLLREKCEERKLEMI